jgi:flavodoxin
LVSMDKLRVYLIKASKTFEGTTAEICAQIGNQINSDLMRVSKEKMNETVENR